MPKYNPKEARDTKRRRQKRIATQKRKRNFRSFTHYAPIIGVIVMLSIVVISIFYLVGNENELAAGGVDDDSGNNNDNQQNEIPNLYQTDLTFTTIEGDTIKLADHKGKVIILFFFGLNCYPCDVEASILIDIDNYYSNSEALIIPIATDPTYSYNDLNNWKNNYNPSWDIVRDDISHSYSSYFSIAYLPTVIILDKNGNIEKKIIGPDQGSYDNIKEEIDTLL